MGKNGSTTMKDVAKALNVSTSLVSYVLNGKGDEMRISQEMQRKVLAMAQIMNYSTNIYACRIRENAAYTPLLAFFWPYQTNAELLNGCFSGIHSLQQDSGQDFDIILQLYESRQLFRYGKRLQGQRSNGTIMYFSAENDWQYIEAHPTSSPITLLNHYSTQYNCTYIHPGKISRQIVELLQQGRYTKVAFLCHPSVKIHRDVSQHLAQDCDSVGIELIQCDATPHEGGDKSGAEMMETLLATHPTPPQLVICFSERLARGASYVLQRKGLRCPEDVNMLVLMNKIQYANQAGSDWSALLYPIDRMCSWCASKLLQLSYISAAAVEAKEFSLEMVLQDSFFKR